MKYLLYCGPGIGDFILSLPMAKAIKIADRDAYIKAFCRSSQSRIVNNKKMMSLQNYIDELDYYASEEPLHSIKLVLANGFKKFDVGIGIQTSKNYNVSTIPSRIINLGSKLTYGFKTKNISQQAYFIASNEPCSPCYGSAQSVLCEHHKCMNNITVEQVFNKIIEMQINSDGS